MAKVKKPKWKEALGSEGAISVKGGAYPVKGTSVGKGKVRGEVVVKPRKRGGAAGNEPLVKTEAGNIKRLTKKQSRALTKADLADLKKTARMKGKTGRKELLRSGKGPPSTTGRDVLLAATGAALATYAATKTKGEKSTAIKSRVSKKVSEKVSSKPKLKKRSGGFMTRQFKDGTSEPYKVIKGSQFINQ